MLVCLAGDKVVVKTETGVFTYKADDPQLVPYSEVVKSTLIWGMPRTDWYS